MMNGLSYFVSGVLVFGMNPSLDYLSTHEQVRSQERLPVVSLSKLDGLNIAVDVNQHKSQTPGRPPNRGSGGGRAPCDEQLVTLVPGESAFSDAEECEESVASPAFTVNEYSRLWLYVPGNYDSGTELRLQLLVDMQPVSEQTFLLSAEAGLISVPLDYPLVMGQSYTWRAEVMVFTGRGRARNPWAGGLIERKPMEQSVMDAIASLPPMVRVQRYLAADLWYGALNELAALRMAEPDNAVVVAAWHDFLTDAGLQIMADQPFLECCWD